MALGHYKAAKSRHYKAAKSRHYKAVKNRRVKTQKMGSTAMPKPGNFKDLSDQQFEDFLVEKISGRTVTGQIQWQGRYPSGVVAKYGSYELRKGKVLTTDPINRPINSLPKYIKEQVLKIRAQQQSGNSNGQEHFSRDVIRRDARDLGIRDTDLAGNIESGVINSIHSLMNAIGQSSEVIRLELQNIRDKADEALGLLSPLK